MKKVIALLMVLLLVLVGCTTPKSEVTPTPVTSETPLPESPPLTEPTQRPVDDSIVFEKTSVKGLFDVYVANPLPEQMTFEAHKSVVDSDTTGSFGLIIKSSDPACTEEEFCAHYPYSYIYATKEEAEKDWLKIEDAIYQYENEELGTIYIFNCYTCGLNCTVQSGAPDYYELLSDKPKAPPVEELLSFEPR